MKHNFYIKLCNISIILDSSIIWQSNKKYDRSNYIVTISIIIFLIIECMYIFAIFNRFFFYQDQIIKDPIVFFFLLIKTI